MSLKCLLNTAGPLLNSVDDGLRAATQVRFVLSGKSQPCCEYVLCWVTSDGSLEHFYSLQDQHTESTFTGDAFVIFQRKQKLPTVMQEVETQDLVCCCRVVEPLDNSHRYEIDLHITDDATAAQVLIVPKPDEEYRIIVRHPSPGYDSHDQTFYIWGDLDFDDYGAGARGRRGVDDAADDVVGLHPYLMNQIVPQTMTGRCLIENDDMFLPRWEDLDHWVIQAQYFWCTEEGESCGGSRALCGTAVRIEPGDLVHTTIKYHAESGHIQVLIWIATETDDHAVLTSKSSQLLLTRPFPDHANLFASWRDFFEKCVASERLAQTCGPVGRPALNVEYKGNVSIPTLQSVCPFEIVSVSYPGCTDQTPYWLTELFCPRLGNTAVLDGFGGEGCRGTLRIADAVYIIELTSSVQ